MATEDELELHRALRESQNRHVYFLLGAAGAAIALAVNQTQSAQLAWSHVPLGMAVICWGLSFWFGCLNRSYNNAGLYTNAMILDVKAGRHPLAGTDPNAIAVARKALRENFDSQSNKTNTFATLQFRFLVGGALFYLAWHVLAMYLRAPSPVT